MTAIRGLGLAFKAEAVLAVQLVLRHRAPRLAAALVLAAVFLAGARQAGGIGPLLLAAGGLGAVFGSRPLARGPALATARLVPVSPWLAPFGRYAGVLAVLLPAVAVAAAVLTAPAPPAAFLRAAAAAAAVGGVWAALVLALAPLVGATAAAALGLLAVVTGIAAPADLDLLTRGVGGPGRIARVAWHALPLPWRAEQWAAGIGWDGVGWLILWSAPALGLAVLLVGRRAR